MSCCNCGQPERLCRCPKGKGEAPKRAYIAECTDCDPCRPCKSMVKICSFVAPTLTEGQKFRNSFVYNQEDDSVYYIDDAGTPTRFGSSPMFIDNFNPDDRKIPRQTVFDFANNKAYVYDPEGDYITVDLAAQSKTLHVYLPESQIVGLTASENGYATLLAGPWYEYDSITVKDDSGNSISPEALMALEDSLIGTNFIVHIPEISISYGGATVHLPASEHAYLASLVTSDAHITQPEGGSFMVMAGSGEFVMQLNVADGTFGDGYDAKIVIPYSLPE